MEEQTWQTLWMPFDGDEYNRDCMGNVIFYNLAAPIDLILLTTENICHWSKLSIEIGAIERKGRKKDK